MKAQCGHCLLVLDLSTAEGAAHVFTHEPRGSAAERFNKSRDRRERAQARAFKYAPDPIPTRRAGRAR